MLVLTENATFLSPIALLTRQSFAGRASLSGALSCSPLIERSGLFFDLSQPFSELTKPASPPSKSRHRLRLDAIFRQLARRISAIFLASRAPGFGCTVALPPVMLDSVGRSLERYMDVLSARQRLVSSNLANADTPGYKTRDLDFQSELRNLTEDGSPRAVEVSGLVTRNDGNNVSVDREARLLAENALRFSTASALMRGQLRSLRTAIQEGKNG
jgi:flagellar basal-body rod protein FlgB